MPPILYPPFGGTPLCLALNRFVVHPQKIQIMKRLFILCALFSGMASANAQTSEHGKWEDNDNSRKVAPMSENQFIGNEIATTNRLVTFTDLPVLSKQIWAVVTNPEGEIMAQKKVSPKDNTIDLRRLSKGELYYVTLVYKNKSKKAFVLHL